MSVERVALPALPDRTMERIRDYVARESLAGRQTSVQEVVERALDTIEQVRKERVG